MAGNTGDNEMKFSIEAFDQATKGADPRHLLAAYPFEDGDGELVWIPRDELTMDQVEEIAAALRAAAEREKAEAAELEAFVKRRKISRAGMRVVDGGNSGGE
jgi:hypothetical protein